jgi:spermidine synthase
MDNAIQSCEVDEYLYHESLVHPAMSSVTSASRVMIIGGGEGATAREVLKWPTVTQVDMYEWDKEVVDEFKAIYPQWAKGAWNDARLTVYYEDIFTVIQQQPSHKYDVIIIDLFEPEDDNKQQWLTLLENIKHWITADGAISIYTGIRNILDKTKQYEISRYILESRSTFIEKDRLITNRQLIRYKVYIPSFSGESMFILLKNTNGPCEINDVVMRESGVHLRDDIWKSYQVFNY